MVCEAAYIHVKASANCLVSLTTPFPKASWTLGSNILAVASQQFLMARRTSVYGECQVYSLAGETAH